VAECNAEDLKEVLPGDVGERWRQIFQVFSPVVEEEDFLRLRFIQS